MILQKLFQCYGRVETPFRSLLYGPYVVLYYQMRTLNDIPRKTISIKKCGRFMHSSTLWPSQGAGASISSAAVIYGLSHHRKNSERAELRAWALAASHYGWSRSGSGVGAPPSSNSPSDRGLVQLAVEGAV